MAEPSRPRAPAEPAPRPGGSAAPEGGAVTIRTLDLSKIREALGEEWSRSSQQIHLLLQGELKRSLSGSGWFWPGDNFYMLVFWVGSDVSPEELCGRIRAMLALHLKGLNPAFANLPMPVNGGHLDARGRVYVDTNESEAPSGGPTMGGRAAQASEGNFVFEPVWNVRQGVVSAFRCVPATSTRRRAPTDKALDAEQMAADALKDETLLKHVMSEWSKLPEGAVCLLITPVHYETLATSGTRRRYLELAGTIPERLRKFLVFEIFDLPPGVMPERLQDFSRYLKAFCRMTSVLVGIASDQFRIVSKSDIPIISCVAEGANEKKLFELMDKFAEGATTFQLQAGIYGVKSPSLTTGAIGAGFVYVGGEAIRSLGEAPVGFFKFEMADVYKGV